MTDSDANAVATDVEAKESLSPSGIVRVPVIGVAAEGVWAGDQMSINEAAAKGFTLLRKAIWANPLDHLRIDIIDGRPGPWAHLYSPMNVAFNGRDPVAALTVGQNLDAREYLAYTGPPADSEPYRAQQATVRA